jgi:hypothetical protein
MKQKADNEDLMVNYLLGELSEDEQLRLEELFFTDDEYYQQLLALEDELIYDYAAGGLAPELRPKFERRFLNSPEARQKAELAKAALAQAAEARTQRAPARTPMVGASKTLWQSLLDFFSLHPALQVSLTAASVALLVGASWLYYQTVRLRSQVEGLEVANADQVEQRARQTAEERKHRDELTERLESERRKRAQLEQELAGQQAQAARDRQPPPSASSSFLSFALSPGLVRSADGPQRLLVPVHVNLLKLQLALNRGGDYRGYRVTLQTLDGAEVWSRDILRAGRSLVVNLPAKLAPPGDYVIALKGRTAAGEMEEIDEYFFTVVKP